MQSIFENNFLDCKCDLGSILGDRIITTQSRGHKGATKYVSAFFSDFLVESVADK